MTENHWCSACGDHISPEQPQPCPKCRELAATMNRAVWAAAKHGLAGQTGVVVALINRQARSQP